jgi:EAL domain-containing protein (putative c-di-GMP-specific phosphodiesterase class I)
MDKPKPIDADLLREGLACQALSLVYQPKIDTRSGKLVGVEALSRWQNQDRGNVDPIFFIKLAEDSGLIHELTRWGLSAALDDWVSWRKAGFTIHLSFNISALSLDDLAFPDLVERLCIEREIPPDKITLELTESASQRMIPLMDTITRIRIKGMGVALDDFGTGYSSLVQLRRLPFTELKIDRCFIEDITEAKDSQLITKAVIDLAHAMGMSATAEGVQSFEGLALLAALGCDQVQGDFISPPMPAMNIPGWKLDLAGTKLSSHSIGQK